MGPQNGEGSGEGRQLVRLRARVPGKALHCLDDGLLPGTIREGADDFEALALAYALELTASTKLTAASHGAFQRTQSPSRIRVF